MNFEDQLEKFKQYELTPFPGDLKGESVNGIELVLLDADISGLLDTYYSSRGILDIASKLTLKKLVDELEQALNGLSGSGKSYFLLLKSLAEFAIK